MATADSASTRGKSVWEKAKLIGGGVIALLLLIIVMQNTEAVETKLLFLTLTMPRAALLLGTLVIGFGVGFLAARRFFRKSRSKPETAAVSEGAPSETP